MKIVTKINFDKVTITESMIEDVYVIEENVDTNKFYIYSYNGYNTMNLFEFTDLEKAISHVKKMIKNYFVDRGEKNPDGF